MQIHQLRTIIVVASCVLRLAATNSISNHLMMEYKGMSTNLDVELFDYWFSNGIP